MLILCFIITSKTIQFIFTSINFYFCHNALMHEYKCFIIMSESLAISLRLEWKIFWSFLLLKSKTNITWTLNIFNLPNNYFNLFLIIGLVLIICNSGSKTFKISQHYRDVDNYYKSLIAHIFLLHQVLLERYKSGLPTFLRFCFLVSLEH